MKKIFKVFNSISIINIIIYLLYSYKGARSKIKELITYIFNENSALTIAEIYRSIIKYCKAEIYVFFLVIIIYLIICIIIKYVYKNKYLKNLQLKKLMDEETPRVYKTIYEYINSKEKRAFLLTGDWGSGKTYTINNFFEKYYKYENKKIYKISCFGLEGRESILKEMKNIFEKEDNSITKKILNLINKIPIIGDFLEGILKSDYEIKDIPENSIFIFDDFERITPLGDISDRIKKRISRRNFTRIQRKNRRMYNSRELYDTKSETTIEYEVLSKYNIVIGIINELVDRYNMKVIILCNTNEINKTFVHEMFECKLDCKKFQIDTNKNIFTDLLNKNLNNNVNLSAEQKENIKKIFDKINDNITAVWNSTRIDNVRILSGIISAFTELVECYNIKQEFYEDIFYSIFLYHILYYNEELDFLRDLKIGENIYCYYLKLNKCGRIGNNAIVNVIPEIDNKVIKWVGIEIASNWLVGENIDCVDNLFKINEYDNGLEEQISKNEDIIDRTKYRFDDLIYILSIDYTKLEEIKNIIKTKEIDFEFYNHKNNEGLNENIDIYKKVRPLFQYFNEDKTVILNDREFIEIVYDKLLCKYNFARVDEKSLYGRNSVSDFIQGYNRYLERKNGVN